MYIYIYENRVIFKNRTAYHLELLTPQTMKFLENTGNKIIKYINGKNVPHLEIIEVVIVHCNIVNNDYE